MKLDEATLDRIGRLSDKADNFYHASLMKALPATIHVEALSSGMEDIRNELREIYFDGGGDPKTWSD